MISIFHILFIIYWFGFFVMAAILIYTKEEGLAMLEQEHREWEEEYGDEQAGKMVIMTLSTIIIAASVFWPFFLMVVIIFKDRMR